MKGNRVIMSESLELVTFLGIKLNKEGKGTRKAGR